MRGELTCNGGLAATNVACDRDPHASAFGKCSAEEAALSRVAAAATTALREGLSLLHEGSGGIGCQGTHVAIEELDVHDRARIDRRSFPQWVAVEIAHQCEAAREHAAMGQRVEQVAAALERGGAISQ